MTVITILILLTQKPEAKLPLLSKIVEWTPSFRVMARGPLDILQWGEPRLEPARRRAGLELIPSTKEIWVAIWAIAKADWLLREWPFANQAEFRSLRLHVQKQITKMSCHFEKDACFPLGNTGCPGRTNRAAVSVCVQQRSACFMLVPPSYSFPTG